MENKILCLELKGQKEVATASTLLQKQESCRILESGQKNGDSFVLLAEGPHFDLHAYNNYSVIDNPHPDLLASYFRLPSPSVEKNLCILESLSLAQLLKASNFLLNKFSFRGIEIYRATNSYPKAIALLCNGEKIFDLPKTQSDVTYKVISKINDFVLKEFF